MLGARLSFSFAVIAMASSAFAQLPPTASDWANMQQDVRGLTQKMEELSLRIEQLERENADLQARLAAAPSQAVTPLELNQAVASLDSQIHAAVTSSRTDILEQVGTQMERLARQTNAALDSLAKNVASGAAVEHMAVSRPAREIAPADAESASSKDGTRYVVQKGDTIGLIAKKTGGRAQDIISANKLTDPSRIMVGQSLIIPQGK